MMPNLNDLASLLSISETPVEVPLENPITFEALTGADGQPSVLLVWGPDSAVMRAVEKEISTDMMEMAVKARGRNVKIDSDKYARKRFLARIDGWRNLSLGGVPFVYSAETKAKVWDEPNFGRIREMFETAMSDNSAFLAGKQNSKN